MKNYAAANFLFFTKTTLLLCCIASTVVSDGLPGEYLLSTRWRDLLWQHSALNNPANLADEEFITVRAAYAPVLQGAFNLGESGLTIPILLRQSVGITMLGEADGNVSTSSFDATSNRLVAGGGSISNNNVFGMLSYAANVWGRINAGANLSLAYQSNFGDPKTGVGFDLGCSWKPLPDNTTQNHTIGLSTVNLIAPSMGAAGSYSRDVRLSWAADFMDQTIESGTDLDLRDFWARTADFKASGDLRAATRALEWGLSCRAGWWIRRMFSLWGQIGFDERALEYWGLAGGVKLPLNAGKGAISMLYQYNIKAEGDWASSHTFYVIANFGKSRKELWAKQIDTTNSKSWFRGLQKIHGLKIEEQKEFIKITADEIAIRFASGSAELPRDSIPVLKEIAGFLRTWPDHLVRIEGHTDSDPITGKLKERFVDNITLSKARCESVKRYFVDIEKLPERLFTTEGFGETKPMYPNTTAANKYKNRRVVIMIIK